MDAYDQERLFHELVEKKITHTEDGLITLPLHALREFHDSIGLEEDEPCFFMLHLPRSEEGFYNYTVGADIDEEATLESLGVYFCDVETGEYEPINGGVLLYGSITRDFISGEMLVCGCFMIDHKGRLWLQGSLSDDIGVDLRVTFESGSKGYSFYTTDMLHTMRLWRDDDYFYCAPSSIFYLGGLPS